MSSFNLSYAQTKNVYLGKIDELFPSSGKGRFGLEYGGYEKLGESFVTNGGLGLIYKVKWIPAMRVNGTNKIQALKCPRNKESLYTDSMESEIDILTRLNSPFIIDIIGCSAHHHVPFITMPWAHGSSLDTWYPWYNNSTLNIFKHASQTDDESSISISNIDLSESEYVGRVLDIIMQISSGLLYAHQQGVTHADIKPANILVVTVVNKTPYLNIKICDFNFSVSNVDGDVQQQDKEQSGAYRSPEQVRKEKPDEKSDSWSLGLVLLEMLTKSKLCDPMNPTSCTNSLDQAKAAAQDRYYKESIDSSQNLITRCLDLNKDSRLSMQEIYDKCKEVVPNDVNRVKSLEDMVSVRNRDIKGRTEQLRTKAKFYQMKYHKIGLSGRIGYASGYDGGGLRGQIGPIGSNGSSDVEKQYKQILGICQEPETKEVLLETYCDTLCDYALFLLLFERADEAENCFKESLSINPNHVSTLHLYGKQLRCKKFIREGKDYIKEAEYMFERALGQDPNHIHTIRNYARLLKDKVRDFSKAKEMYDKAMEIDPEHPATLFLFASLLKTSDDLRDLERAEELIRRYIEIDTEINPRVEEIYQHLQAKKRIVTGRGGGRFSSDSGRVGSRFNNSSGRGGGRSNSDSGRGGGRFSNDSGRGGGRFNNDNIRGGGRFSNDNGRGGGRSNYRTVLCRFYVPGVEGSCTHGNTCTFSHEDPQPPQSNNFNLNIDSVPN